jgi:hypothetical protein
VKVRHDEGEAIHIGPEPCVAVRKGVDEALVEEGAGQPLSHEIRISGCRPVSKAEGNTAKCVIASTWLTRRGRRTWHVSKLLGREPGGPRSGHSRMRWSALGRRGAVANDARSWEVRFRHSSCEADEQSRATGRGAGGAKGGGRGECATAKHLPGTAPGKRVTGAGAHTASREASERRRSACFSGLASTPQGGSRVPELGPLGSVRGGGRPVMGGSTAIFDVRAEY